MSYSPLRISASKSSIVILHSDIIRLLFKKVRVKKKIIRIIMSFI